MNSIKLAIVIVVLVGGFTAGGIMFDATIADGTASQQEGVKTLFSISWMLWTAIGAAFLGGIGAAIYRWIKK